MLYRQCISNEFLQNSCIVCDKWLRVDNKIKRNGIRRGNQGIFDGWNNAVGRFINKDRCFMFEIIGSSGNIPNEKCINNLSSSLIFLFESLSVDI